MKRRLQIQPLDSIMVRDGRPFNNTPGVRAHTLGDITPSVLAGTVRTMLAKRRQAYNGSSSPIDYFSKLPVFGPLYRWQGSLYYPMPQDAELYEENGKIGLHKVMPVNPDSFKGDGQGFYGIGADGRLEDKLWLPLGAGKHKAVQNAPAYVSADWMQRWLSESLTEAQVAAQINKWREEVKAQAQKPPFYIEDAHVAPHEAPLFLPAFHRQERTHTAIDAERHAAKEKYLYSTESLVFPDGLTLEAEVDLPAGELGWTGELSELHTMGGERRLAHFSGAAEPPSQQVLWGCPDEIKKSLEGVGYIRMVLATPAFFRKGWQPGWLNEYLESQPLWDTGVKLRLLWACIPRWQPVSGWSYSQQRKGFNEKAIRRLVPAGSVYFFRVLEGNASCLAETCWLQSVSDANRRKGAFDKEDGYGLALWGKWEPVVRADG